MFGNIFRQYGKAKKLESELKSLEERGLKEPDNLSLQVRIGDLLAKAGMRERAIALYRSTAEKFAQKKQFSQAMALNKIVQRLEPSEKNKEWYGKIYMKWVNMAEEYKQEICLDSLG